MELLNELRDLPLGEIVLFAVLAGAAVGGALFTITRRNPVTAVMSLVFTFFAMAGIFASLSAHFVAVLQVLVYAGAIMVLFIFVVMILNREEVEPVSFKGIVRRVVGVVATGYIVLVCARVVWSTRDPGAAKAGVAALSPDYGTVGSTGLSLFKDFVYPFEAISLLLLVAIVGGVILSRSHKQEEMAEEVARRHAAVRAAARPETRLGPAPAGGEPHDSGGAHAAHH